MAERIFYFGCWDEAGQFLFDPDHLQVRDHCDKGRMHPFGDWLDGGPFLPRPEHKGEGAITHLPDWTVLAWWGSPWDSRPNVNTAVLVEVPGLSLGEVWSRFMVAFPSLAQRLMPPMLRRGGPWEEVVE